MLSYADWVANGTDAWVCALGVPQRKPVGEQEIAGNPTRVGGSRALLSGDTKLEPKPVNPLATPWSATQAFLHSIVAGNDGVVESSCPDIPDAINYVNHVLNEGFETWIKSQKPEKPRLVIYAHGGLNAMESGIVRARVVGPYLKNNGIYPIFYIWKTGFIETLAQSLEDTFAAPDETGRMATGVVSDARDRLIESICHGPLKWAWRQMKQNAEAAKESDHAIGIMVQAISKLKAKYPSLEVHIVGHSAGSFVAGHLLSMGLKATSLSLFAPACSLSFALKNIKPYAPLNRTYLRLLTDEAEKSDHVGSKLIYGKSLLWLVSRGFEEKRKTPLAGFARALDSTVDTTDNDLWDASFSDDLNQWRAWTKSMTKDSGSEAIELVASHKLTIKGKEIPGEHGGFDNDIAVIEGSIRHMLNLPKNMNLMVPVEDLRY